MKKLWITLGRVCAFESLGYPLGLRVVYSVLIASLIFGTSVTFASATSIPIVVARAPVASGNLQLFATEAAAQAHCPSDVVVWLNTNTGIYHEKGMRWYGNTKHGAYVCRKEADAAGDRDTRNGQ